MTKTPGDGFPSRLLLFVAGFQRLVPGPLAPGAGQVPLPCFLPGRAGSDGSSLGVECLPVGLGGAHRPHCRQRLLSHRQLPDGVPVLPGLPGLPGLESLLVPGRGFPQGELPSVPAHGRPGPLQAAWAGESGFTVSSTSSSSP